MSRPRKSIDRALVISLASIACTTEEIARIAGVSKDTIERRCKEELEQGRAEAKRSLRRYQFEAAKKGNAALLIWLGKQLLGQKDKHQDDDDDGQAIPLTYNLDD